MTVPVRREPSRTDFVERRDLFIGGAFLALARQGAAIQGSLELIGTPAEEGGGGKIKLLEAGGVYWKGDEKNERLQRIYGTAFSTQKEASRVRPR